MLQSFYYLSPCHVVVVNCHHVMWLLLVVVITQYNFVTILCSCCCHLSMWLFHSPFVVVITTLCGLSHPSTRLSPYCSCCRHPVCCCHHYAWFTPPHVVVARCVDEPKYKGKAGNVGAFFLMLGITAGILFSLPVTIFIKNATW